MDDILDLIDVSPPTAAERGRFVAGPSVAVGRTARYAAAHVIPPPRTPPPVRRSTVLRSPPTPEFLPPPTPEFVTASSCDGNPRVDTLWAAAQPHNFMPRWSHEPAVSSPLRAMSGPYAGYADDECVPMDIDSD